MSLSANANTGYGYYFILSEPCSNRLFTQVDAVENIRLFNRRENDGTLHAAKRLSYVVIRVSEQIRLSSKDQMPPVLPHESAEATKGSPDISTSSPSPSKSGRKTYCRGMFPPLQDTVGDIELLRHALRNVESAPPEEFRESILTLMRTMKTSR